MALIGVDDTDSRTAGMCTTWIASEICTQLPETAATETFLVRLHPAIEYKTRGNGAVAIQADVDVKSALSIASAVVDEWAVHDDPDTNPGIVVAEEGDATTEELQSIACDAIRGPVSRSSVDTTLRHGAFESQSWGNGRGLIGATAAVGAAAARHQHEPPFDDWTLEYLVYRRQNRWGTDRSVTVQSRTAISGVTGVWDTVDPISGDLVCVPNSPCPVLYGIRGGDRLAIQSVAQALDGEPKARSRWFITNQGTDAHLISGEIGTLRDGTSYRVRGRVTERPTTKTGGHVHFSIGRGGYSRACVAFAPTGRFREWVNDLRVGDEVIVCGECSENTIKLEKFALCEPVLSTWETPTCDSCARRMKSAGRGQGYRCKACGTNAPGKVLAPLERRIETGWYEVPPNARRHLAAPLIRGNYELPIHPTTGDCSRPW